MSFEHSFSGLDRFLHALAFNGTGLQMAVADIEDRLYAARYAEIPVDRPVFVTSLPRAGTTLLLEVLSAHPCFATHTYREMPFVLCPILWHSVSRSFRRTGGRRERAHGDGMAVDYDSVEAFEEILWRAFWPEKYRDGRIDLWDAADIDADDEFGAFLANHVRKLIALRRQHGAETSRYVSKNNANVARLPALARLFPDAVILIPFRNPVDHVGSMLRQHLNFKKIHGEDAFARRYMQGIGHLEFGEALCPIDFGGWLDRADVAASESPDYWLAYWCAAFEHVLETRPASARLVSYDASCRAATDALRKIAAEIGVEDPEPLLSQADRFRPPSGYGADEPGGSPELVERAFAIHDRLRDAAILQTAPPDRFPPINFAFRTMKVWLPYIHAGSGSDVYTERLADGLRAAGHEAVLTPVDRRWQYLPWRYLSVPAPADTDITLANLGAGFAFRRPGRKLVLVEHHCVFDPAFAPYRSRKQALIHETLLRYIERKSLKVCDALVTVSAYTARSLQETLGGPAPTVILNGIETDYFTPPETPAPRADGQPFGLLFVGNLSRRKGADLLPAIMSRLGPGFELRYTIGLRSDDPFAGVAGMHRLGRLSQDELRAAYRDADALLFPSRLEGFGYAAAEAMACGTPAVVAASSALPELIDDGVDGRLCPVDDLDGFAAAIQELAADPDKLADMGRRARAKAIDKFSLSAMTEQYVMLFERLLA